LEAAPADGQRQSLAAYRGQALLIVNVASRCTLTPQYAALEALYRRHADRGFTILGFPCNQFGRQEQGTNAEIQSFCRLNYDVTFPVFAKIDVNGAEADPLFRFLSHEQRGFLGTTSIKWNFTKFLIDRQGRVVRRFPPQASAHSIERALLPLLAQAPAAAS